MAANRIIVSKAGYICQSFLGLQGIFLRFAYHLYVHFVHISILIYHISCATIQTEEVIPMYT